MTWGCVVHRSAKFLLWSGAILTIMTQPAYAYIDPGLGSLLVQSLVAGFLAIGVAWAGFKMKIMSFFERRKAGSQPKE
jgi:hypothetical protein